MENELRALSWKEPFATLMLYSKIETRKWATDYRGLVLICASKKPYTPEQINQISAHQQERIAQLYMKHGLSLSDNLGKAIAIGELVDCRPMQLEDEDACFVYYWENLYCHIYKNVRAIEPIPYKGQQGWKKLDSEFMKQVKYKE